MMEKHAGKLVRSLKYQSLLCQMKFPRPQPQVKTCGDQEFRDQEPGCVEMQNSFPTCPSDDHESESSSEPDESDSTMSSTSSTLSIVPDQRKFASDKYERLFPWLYFSSSKNG